MGGTIQLGLRMQALGDWCLPNGFSMMITHSDRSISAEDVMVVGLDAEILYEPGFRNAPQSAHPRDTMLWDIQRLIEEAIRSADGLNLMGNTLMPVRASFHFKNISPPSGQPEQPVCLCMRLECYELTGAGGPVRVGIGEPAQRINFDVTLATLTDEQIEELTEPSENVML